MSCTTSRADVVIHIYIGFAHSLAKSKKNLLRLLFETSSLNLNTVIGQNRFYLKKKFEYNNLQAKNKELKGLPIE